MPTYSNSPLVSYTKISPNKNTTRVHEKYNPKGVIDKITIHHMAGNLSIEGCGCVFAPGGRQASSNYGIGSDGRIGMYVEEKHRPWTSSSAENDYRAITIEVANDKPSDKDGWHVSDKAMASLVNLCIDICKRNGIKKINYTGDKRGNLTMHCWFAPTGCPGPYLKSKFPWIAEQVNKRLNASSTVSDNTTSSSLKAGEKLKLSNTPLYVSASTKTKSGSITGTYYVWNSTQVSNRIRITNSPTNVGKSGQVTGWIDVSNAKKSTTTNTATLKSGSKLNLSNIPLYVSAYSTTKSGTKTGTYYAWSASIVNNKIRITNSASNVGKSGQVTGWINVSDAKKALV